MGFLDKIFNIGKAYAGNRSPKLACELTMEGQKYLLEAFDLDFDAKSERRYVPMYITFLDRLAPELESWITRSDKRRDGRVKFYRNVESPEEGAVFTLTFHDAVCVRYRKTAQGDEPATTLVLAAKGIKLMEQEF